ncbi:hypothetical protein GCM10027093_10430 [Paraburkholderia jirisanensis]
MTACIPREERVSGQIEFVNQMRHPRGMLMAAVKQDHGAAARHVVPDRPMPVEKLLAVVRGERPFFGVAKGHGRVLMQELRLRILRKTARGGETAFSDADETVSSQAG